MLAQERHDRIAALTPKGLDDRTIALLSFSSIDDLVAWLNQFM